MPSRTPLFALVTIAALLGAAPIAAQAGTASRSNSPGPYTYAVATQGIASDSASAALVRRIRSDLSALRLAEEAYFAEHHTYAAVASALPDFQPRAGAEVVLLNVTASGWEAVATHPALAGGKLRATVTKSVEKSAAGR